MAREEVDTIRRSYEALNQGDVEGALSPLHEEVEWRESPALPEADTFRGRRTVRRFLQDYLESWQEFHQEVEDVIEAHDKFVVLVHLVATGRESGVRVDASYAHVWTMAEGKATRVDAYYDRELALESVGVDRSRSVPARP